MKFIVKDLNSLVEAVNLASDGDRITLITATNDKLREYTKDITFIIHNNNILLRDIEDNDI